MKNAFYFILKALSVLKIFQFLIMTFWSCRKSGLIRKTVKLGQLIDYNKGNILLQKLCRKRGKTTSSRHLFIFQVCSMGQRQVVCSLVSICFGGPRLGVRWGRAVWGVCCRLSSVWGVCPWLRDFPGACKVSKASLVLSRRATCKATRTFSFC